MTIREENCFKVEYIQTDSDDLSVAIPAEVASTAALHDPIGAHEIRL